MTTSVPTFNFLALLISEIKRVSRNLMWGLLAPCRTSYAETFTCAQSTWQGQTARQISASYLFMHHAVMGINISHRLTIICAQKLGFGGFEGEDVKLLSPDPQINGRVFTQGSAFWAPKGTALREYASVYISHDKIGSTA